MSPPLCENSFILLMARPASMPTLENSNVLSPPDAQMPAQPPTDHGWRRSYWALNITQFQGAFSTNAFQNLLSYMVLSMGLTHAQEDRMVPLILLFFSVPLILFSMVGGFLADRFSKR